MEKTDITVAVCDAGPLIHLDELNATDLLNDFPRIVIGPTVIGEVTLHRKHFFASPRFEFEVPVHLGHLQSELKSLAQALGLHRGELEALVLARSHQNCVLLTDDTAARLAARSMGVRAHGTLGILIRAVRRGMRGREEILQLIRSIPQKSSLHVKPSLLEEVSLEFAGANKKGLDLDFFKGDN